MTEPSDFCPRRARSKRPLPLWSDAFFRDTRTLETDEVGAYVLILMAMWSSKECALPDDDRKLARAAGVSTRLWKSRVGPTILPLLIKCDEGVTQKRLREEAAYTERQVTQQRCRKTGENPDKYLKTNDVDLTADNTVDKTPDEPTQQPNNPTIATDGEDARASNVPKSLSNDQRQLFRKHVMGSINAATPGNLDPPPAQWAEAERWMTDLGLHLGTITEVIGSVLSKKRDGPPTSLRYFTDAMRETAGAIAAPPVTPTQPAPPALSEGSHHGSAIPSAQRRHDPRADGIAELHRGFQQAVAKRSGGG